MQLLGNIVMMLVPFDQKLKVVHNTFFILEIGSFLTGNMFHVGEHWRPQLHSDVIHNHALGIGYIHVPSTQIGLFFES